MQNIFTPVKTRADFRINVVLLLLPNATLLSSSATFAVVEFHIAFPFDDIAIAEHDIA
jgi:hypothetical protein